MALYTAEQWHKDETFKADPGQEIEEAIYNAMLDIMPPVQLPRAAKEKALADFGLGIFGGFLMGEPADTDKETGEPVYHAFGSGDGKFYYLGKFPAREPKVEVFYYMRCGNAFVEGLYPAAQFDDDTDAINKAADYEATLYKVTYTDGKRTNAVVLWDPKEH